MALNAGTTVIPSDTYTVLEGGTVDVSLAFERSVGVIGGMDVANGTATAGDVVEVDSPSDAQEKFGEGSELHEQIRILYQNGVGEVHALPLAETTTTESFTASSSGTLSNVPPMDPTIHDEHSITAQDTVAAASVEVNIVYDDPPTNPTSSNTMNLNPVTGDWAADASSDYDITYTYGDWSSSAIAPLVDRDTRKVAAMTETESVVNTVETEVRDNADNFQFSGIVAGAHPFASTTSPDTTNYSDGMDSERVSLVASPRGFVDDAETNQHRTVGAVAGEMASLELGRSSTNNSVSGLTGLRTDLTFSEASDLIDAQVVPLIDYPPVTIVKDMTTSTTARFERVVTIEVIDEVTEQSHLIAKEFIGDQNTDSNRNQLRRSHRNALNALRTSDPPLLDDFTLTVKNHTSDPNTVVIEIGLDVVDVIDTIDVTITVGNIVRGGI